MLYKCLLILVAGLFINSQAVWAEKAPELAEELPAEQESSLVEFTELEYQLLETSDLLSLSQQIKYRAQRLIEEGSKRPEQDDKTRGENTNKEQVQDLTEAEPVYINHAQHFAIAKSLAKDWREEAWQQKLLELLHSLPLETQVVLQQQMNNPMLISAREKEKAAISVQHSGAYQLYMNKLRQRPPGATRWQLVEDLDRQSGFSAMIIQARAVVNKTIQQQVEGWQADEFWQNQTRQEVLEFLFYAYRKTPNNQLKHITDSFNQVELKQFYQQVRSLIH